MQARVSDMQKGLAITGLGLPLQCTEQRSVCMRSSWHQRACLALALSFSDCRHSKP